MIIRGLCTLLILAFFTGCSPGSLAPGTRTNPTPTSFSTVAKIKPNGETFVRAVGPAGLLSSRIAAQEELKFTSYNEVAPGTTRRISVNWVEQIAIRAPESWQFEIVRQEGVATILQTTATGGGISYRVSYTLELIVSVKVPAGTPPGRYNTIMQIAEVGKPQNTGPVYFNFEVEKAE